MLLALPERHVDTRRAASPRRRTRRVPTRVPDRREAKRDGTSRCAALLARREQGLGLDRAPRGDRAKQ
jgi:hypothetical protein